MREAARRTPAASIALAGFLAMIAGPASAAAGWTATNSAGGAGADKAGLSAGNNFDTIWFTCENEAKGRVRLIFTGFEAGLEGDLDRTVVVTVDGTAFRQTTRAAPNDMDGGSDLVRAASMADLEELIAALKTGSKAEIASPLGRRTISLRGSGKALAALQAGCR